MKIDIDEALTISGACKLFGRTEMTIYLWREKRNLPYITFPGSDRTMVRFIKTDLIEWAEREGQQVFDDAAAPQSLIEFHNYITEDADNG